MSTFGPVGIYYDGAAGVSKRDDYYGFSVGLRHPPEKSGLLAY
jgi:hypothetical protein